MQVNQPKGGTAEATTPPLAIGDKVSYVAMSGGGPEYRLSASTGVIEAIDGDVAIVRTANGRSITKPLDKLTPDGKSNSLTRMIMGG
ncbi:hypothetical protein ACQKMW_02135 [Pseudomonas sivasensis]|uniref:hypothetical protein n=1 Tax=Pseudomonas sivasensis TaxID=1880678 RepID=UPI003D07BC11